MLKTSRIGRATLERVKSLGGMSRTSLQFRSETKAPSFSRVRTRLFRKMCRQSRERPSHH